MAKLVVVGGGAAGFFGAITAAERGHQVTLLETSQHVLAKVRVSGGGRCNLTHACFDPRELVQAYPRGGKELRGPLARFQPADTMAWFADRGVETKTEFDGRMFPATDDSATIVECLQRAAEQAGVSIRTRARVDELHRADGRFEVSIRGESPFISDCVLLATGGSRAGFDLAKSLGHSIVPPVPSLFTFEISDARLQGLQGVSVDDVACELVVSGKRFKQRGPLLVTHWGLSGPAVLKLSSWAARELHQSQYAATLRIHWLPHLRQDEIQEQLIRQRQENAKRAIDAACPWRLPKRLWKSLADDATGTPVRWAELSKKSLDQLVRQLTEAEFQVSGKGQFKEEFVTCGGIQLDEVDFRTMQSRLCPGLYFAGEVLDIDAITGGYNFQSAWTTAWIAGNSMDSVGG